MGTSACNCEDGLRFVMIALRSREIPTPSGAAAGSPPRPFQDGRFEAASPRLRLVLSGARSRSPEARHLKGSAVDQEQKDDRSHLGDKPAKPDDQNKVGQDTDNDGRVVQPGHKPGDVDGDKQRQQ